jgi:hypothetical protein
MTDFRLATEADLPALRRLVERAYRGDTARQGWTHEADLLDDERTSDAELAAAIAAPDRRLIVAQAGMARWSAPSRWSACRTARPISACSASIPMCRRPAWGARCWRSAMPSRKRTSAPRPSR